MRKSLVIGIDFYANFPRLSGCVNDAKQVAQILSRNEDGSLNFPQPKLLTSSTNADYVSRAKLRESILQLFQGESEIALLYFAGHGYADEIGGFICASDAAEGDDGVSLNDVITAAKQSRAANKIIILDCCHSGIAGNRPGGETVAEISHGLTILAASSEDQYAYEGGNGAPGVFTNLLVDALSGAASNLTGDVTPGAVYAHIDQSLGPWGGQRPVFKTNVKTFISLRKTIAPIALSDLQLLTSLFASPDNILPLNPTYEPERTKEQAADGSIPPPDPDNVRVFGTLQNMARVNLVRPVGTRHMYHAAWESKSCELTLLGKHYWRLVASNLV